MRTCWVEPEVSGGRPAVAGGVSSGGACVELRASVQTAQQMSSRAIEAFVFMLNVLQEIAYRKSTSTANRKCGVIEVITTE